MAAKHAVYRPPGTDAEHAERTREVVRTSRKVLERASPDTFLGRKTQEPFPEEEGKEATFDELLSRPMT